MTTIAVLDYGSGNVHSAVKALAATGAEVVLTRDAKTVRDAHGLVVPGVGAFASVMAQLRAVGADDLIRERVRTGRDVLGICVGLQVMFDVGHEHGEEAAGLGILRGTVERLTADCLPHMGWNTVEVEQPEHSRLFRGITDERFYFVHSYGVHKPAAAPSGNTPAVIHTHSFYGGDRFLAAIEDGPVAATQFHPEKSGRAGLRLLANWVESLG